MDDAVSRIISILRADTLRWHLLEKVRALNLPDCWIGAGFIRNAVWDHLHDRAASPPTGDVDVIWYDPERIDPAFDRQYEAVLVGAVPSLAWSVKNQARMHVRNADAPYASAVEAMRYWPETATAVAARRRDAEDCEIAAPLGLDDLLNMILRPTPRFTREKRDVYDQRLETKGWMASWPLLRRIET